MNEDKLDVILKVVVIALALSLCLPFIMSDNTSDSHHYDYNG